MLILHGLAVDVVGDPAALRRPDADVRWLRRRSSAPLGAAPPTGWAWRVFAGQGGAACGFAVSPDAREVISETTDVVREQDEFGLFAEAVMRTVLRRQGLVSFHAAALARGRRAVLILGAKGAGKSSLAAALSRSGWSLMADDLARVVQTDGAWRVAAGFRQIKLNPDVAAALGHDVSKLERRWSVGQPWPKSERLNKRVLPHFEWEGDEPTLPIAAVYALAPRVSGAQALTLTASAPTASLALLLRHLSDDPIGGSDGASAEARAAVMSFLAAVPLIRLALPDDLAQLPAAATALPGA